MSYKLKFLPAALKEWRKLAPPVREQFKKKLAKVLINPRIPAAKLSGFDSVYKIKLRTAGYRLAYEVIDKEVVVYVLAVGKRNKDEIYKQLSKRV